MEEEFYPNFVVMEVATLTYDWMHSFPVVTLRERQSPHRELSIPLGMSEATALHHAINKVPRSRPGTHDFLQSVLMRTQIDLVCCRIIGRREAIYFAEIDLMTPKGRETLDCRVSDGLVLSHLQRVEAPVLCDEVLLNN